MSTTTIPRPEYPRPQFVREQWQNLNGEWEFEIDHGRSGEERGLPQADSLQSRILVPFCPESALSGVQYRDFMAAVWYRRTFTVPERWQGKRVLLHFGAVDYDAHVWINGKSAGSHRGGYTPFALDITDLLQPGQNVVTLCAEDDVRSGLQPRGKQSALYESHHCDYTRTTGIWQTVWLECVHATHIGSIRVHPDPQNGAVRFDAALQGSFVGCTLRMRALYDGQPVGECELNVGQAQVQGCMALQNIRLWDITDPFLYDLELELLRGDEVLDTVRSYFGLRSLSWAGKAMCLNGRPLFQRLVLDQGYYPDGIYTAPTDDALKRDIELSMAMGFNGARLHQKVFEPRFLYWADRLGYLVWGEYANWGLNITTPMGLQRFLPEWMEAMQRDINHPSLVGWCPFNETWDLNGTRQDDAVLAVTARATRLLDPTRPVIDTSGNYHVDTDVFDVHDYEQNPAVFASRYGAQAKDGGIHVTFADRQRYEGQPYFVSEYGGTWWSPEDTTQASWGYGNRPATQEEFLSRYEGLTTTLLDNPNCCAFCYTQLYDVEQERNGLYTYTREPKFDPQIIRRINERPAAIEK